MGDDQYPIPERDMKDFQFRQMKKIRVFDSPDDLQKERSSLLAISNKFGVTFVGLDRTLKIYLTREIIAAAKVDGNINEIVENVKCQVLSVDLPMHHLALSSDELTLSVCGVSDDAALTMDFYDVRTFFNKARQEKRPFASFKPEAALGTAVQDLKWSPVDGFKLAACLSDGSMIILDVINDVTLVAQLPATVGITCVCWSPKGKQVAAGKLNGTVVQYTPTLQEKKVIPCAPFYSTDPVKVLDVLWLSTFNFAVAYAAADGSPVTPPDLVVISLPKKDEKRPDQYLNFGDLVYGSCTEREHHYFLCHVEDWDLVLAASAASIEVSVIAKQEDKTNWELWVLEDAARGELPVTLSNDDTLPVGVAIDYTSQGEIYISDDKKLPPAPTLLILSTDGVLCPFSLINLNPGVKQLVTAAGSLALDGERPPLTKLSSAPPAYVPPASNPPSIFSSFQMPPTTAPVAPPPAATSAPPAAPASSSFGMSFSLPPPAYTAPTSTAPASTGPSLFSFSSASSSTFSFAAPKPAPAPTSAPSASSFSFSAPAIKPPAETSSAQAPPPQRVATASPITVLKPPPEPATPNVRMNLNDRFLAVDGPAAGGFGARPFSSTPIISSQPTAQFSITKPAPTAVTRPVQTSTPPVAVQKTAAPTPPSAPSTAPSTAPSIAPSTAPQQPVSVKPVEKPLQLKRDADPVMIGILEEIAHFQKEMDELKARSNRADFRVGSSEEMRDLRKESEDLHGFTLEIKETTESLHGDISTLKTTLLEGFAGVEEARAQRELNRDKGYLQLLYKKPLDPRSDQQLKEIRKLYQYVKFAVEDVNDVLDVEWEKHLEKKKKQRHMIIPEREALYTALANNMDIINQQKQKLDQLVRDLQSLRLYNKTSTWNSCSQPASTPSSSSSTRGLDSELESLRNALVKASLETAPKAPSKSPSKMTPVKQSQLRNFLSKRQTPPVRSTAPANLSRSAFLSPKYYEDLDDVSSTSSLSQSQEPEEPLALAEEEEEELPAIPMLTPRHPTVVRTASIQPGFPMQPSPFSRVQMPPKISMDSADSTILATKTVKHGPPPTTTIPAAQAAALAALTRQRNSEKPAPTSLNESTLKNVPQVVNVQELKDKGPPMPVSTVISPSVPAPAAQVVQQVLAAVGAKKNPSVNVPLTVPDSTATPQTFMFVPPSAAPSATPGSIFTPPVTSFTPVQSAAAEAPAAPRQPSSSSSKPFSFSSTPSSTPFSFPLSSTTSQPPAAPSSQGKDVGPESKFLSSSEAPFSFSPKPSASSTGGPSSKATASGETLGSFSCLRVGQSEEVRDTTATQPGFAFGVPGNGAAFTFGSQQKPAAPGNGQSSVPVTATDVSRPSEPAAPLTTKPAFTGAPSPAPLTSFSSLLASPLPSEIPSTTEQPRLPPASGPSPPPELEARPLEPSPEPPAATTPSPVLVGEELAPVPAPATAFVVPSQPEPQAAAAQTGEQLTTQGLTTQVVPALNVMPTPQTLAEPAAVVETLVPEAKPLPMSTPAPAPVATQASLEQPSSPALAAHLVAPVAAAAPAQSAAATTAAAIPVLAPAQAPPSTTPGSIFAQPAIVTTTNGTTLSVTSFTPVISTAGLATPSSASVTPVAPSTASQAPASIFGQPGTVAPTATTTTTTSSAPVFGTSTFGAASATSGFGKPVFGQSSSGGFGQPAASAGSASGFTFGQSTFGATSGFGQTNPPANAPASNAAAGGGGGGAGGGGLFGSSSTSSASSFSFGASSTSSSASTGTNLFGQNTAPAFGQQQGGGFGQPSMFGSNTTTTTSSGFGFGQPAAFGSTPTPSGFGQQPSGGSVFGQQQPSSGGNLFGSGPGNPASTGGGFFSGLGGKPSEDAANKNPFGTNPTGGFGQPNQPGSTSLFGNSGAKAFGFGANTFGEQKPSGTFSAGGGSVAAQGFGSFSTPAKTGGFGAAPVFGSPPAFGGSPAFGSTATFGNSPGFNNQMGASPGKVFGEGTSAASVGGFGAPSFGNMPNPSSAPSFGSLAQQGSGFGTPQNQNVGFSAFGSSAGFGGFGNNNTNQSGSQTFGGWRS